MFESHTPHQLLAQVPLTVSPFLSLPSAVTLPYSFRAVPTSLPPSITGDSNAAKQKYVTSSSGHTAHPSDIIDSCKSLKQYLRKTSAEARKRIEIWEQSIKDRDLAEKRRVAPGWLDREEKLLEPTKVSSSSAELPNLLEVQSSSKMAVPTIAPSRDGEELDRAFGTLGMK